VRFIYIYIFVSLQSVIGGHIAQDIFSSSEISKYFILNFFLTPSYLHETYMFQYVFKELSF